MSTERDVLSDHFVMWRQLDGGGGPHGEWYCQCGLKFGFSTSVIDHQAAMLTERTRGVAARRAAATEIADLLAEHRVVRRGMAHVVCQCAWRTGMQSSLECATELYEMHLAASLADLLAGDT